ncbi:PREDICTED: uncharacterized protein LOC106812846 [Priapulus caudatus]|uniref:Uncharacterized protein LOC106812846 n=1 Tax=Priapulus caudatus TaxID=37621 RepID=A0ABM1EJE3_PRICU|nr:PREDICTED: uncharacterized protein LOC106812846 [Priapulus caudatus]
MARAENEQSLVANLSSGVDYLKIQNNLLGIKAETEYSVTDNNLSNLSSEKSNMEVEGKPDVNCNGLHSSPNPHSPDVSTLLDNTPFRSETQDQSLLDGSITRSQRRKRTRNLMLPAETYETFYFCLVCSQGIGNKKGLADHMREFQHGESPRWKAFQCPSCQMVFANAMDVVTHRETQHDLRRQFVCDVCGLAYHRKKYFFHHRLTHGSRRRIACDRCGVTCSTRQVLRRHMTLHRADAPYRCAVCQKRFKSDDRLRAHVRMHVSEAVAARHDDTAIAARRTDGAGAVARRDGVVKPVECETCGKTFKQQQLLHAHTARFHGNAASQTHGRMRDHVAVETTRGGERHACGVCQRVYTSQVYLERHTQLHLEARWRRSHVFTLPATRVTHGHDDNVDNTFICSACDDHFHSQVALTSHVNDVHRGVPRLRHSRPASPPPDDDSARAVALWQAPDESPQTTGEDWLQSQHDAELPSTNHDAVHFRTESDTATVMADGSRGSRSERPSRKQRFPQKLGIFRPRLLDPGSGDVERSEAVESAAPPAGPREHCSDAEAAARLLFHAANKSSSCAAQDARDEVTSVTPRPDVYTSPFFKSVVPRKDRWAPVTFSDDPPRHRRTLAQLLGGGALDDATAGRAGALLEMAKAFTRDSGMTGGATERHDQLDRECLSLQSFAGEDSFSASHASADAVNARVKLEPGRQEEEEEEEEGEELAALQPAVTSIGRMGGVSVAGDSHREAMRQERLLRRLRRTSAASAAADLSAHARDRAFAVDAAPYRRSAKKAASVHEISRSCGSATPPGGSTRPRDPDGAMSSQTPSRDGRYLRSCKSLSGPAKPSSSSSSLLQRILSPSQDSGGATTAASRILANVAACCPRKVAPPSSPMLQHILAQRGDEANGGALADSPATSLLQSILCAAREGAGEASRTTGGGATVASPATHSSDGRRGTARTWTSNLQKLLMDPVASSSSSSSSSSAAVSFAARGCSPVLKSLLTGGGGSGGGGITATQHSRSLATTPLDRTPDDAGQLLECVLCSSKFVTQEALFLHSVSLQCVKGDMAMDAAAATAPSPQERVDPDDYAYGDPGVAPSLRRLLDASAATVSRLPEPDAWPPAAPAVRVKVEPGVTGMTGAPNLLAILRAGESETQRGMGETQRGVGEMQRGVGETHARRHDTIAR